MGLTFNMAARTDISEKNIYATRHVMLICFKVVHGTYIYICSNIIIK